MRGKLLAQATSISLLRDYPAFRNLFCVKEVQSTSLKKHSDINTGSQYIYGTIFKINVLVKLPVFLNV